MHVLGVDLSGPANVADTEVACFAPSASALRFVQERCDGSDGALYELVARLAAQGPVVIGVDAPLSYQPGGGDRCRDTALRRLIVRQGMRPGSVMPPTAPRMVYLTL